MERIAFEALLNSVLTPHIIKDYCPNGLQVQGNDVISKIVTGVTASQELIDKAIEMKADTLIVHHGYFWKNEDYVIRGMKHKRIKALLDNNINLFAYHLPLDIHPELGNNAQLAKLLDIAVTGRLDGTDTGVTFVGELENEASGEAFSSLISQKLARECLHIAPPSNKPIKTVAWCTGGGQSFIDEAAEKGFDAFITGEASEKTTHTAREMDIHFFAAGHHATERYGAKALAEFLKSEYQLDAAFIDIDNPV